jgi:hypothetical protein
MREMWMFHRISRRDIRERRERNRERNRERSVPFEGDRETLHGAMVTIDVTSDR